MHKERNN